LVGLDELMRNGPRDAGLLCRARRVVDPFEVVVLRPRLRGHRFGSVDRAARIRECAKVALAAIERAAGAIGLMSLGSERAALAAKAYAVLCNAIGRHLRRFGVKDRRRFARLLFPIG